MKAVLFDLDGTLLNRDVSVKLFIEDQYERLSLSLSHIPKQKYISRFIALDCRGYVWKDKVFKQIIDEFSINGITWEALLQDYINHFKYHCVPFANLISTLELLKARGLILGIITNGRTKFQLDNIRALSMEHFFNSIFISEAEGIKKPDPKIFITALERLGVTAKESIFVGDHPEKDIWAAQVIGMKGIWKRDHQWSDVTADFTIDDLAEIPIIVDELKRNSLT